MRAASLKLLAVALIACIGVGGLLAATGAASPAVQTAANLANSVKKALKLGKSADRKATNALATARRAEKASVAGRQGPAGPAGPQGGNGANGTNGSNGTDGSNGSAGPTGPTGAAGATGATGPQGAVGLWEVFEATSSGAVHKRGTAMGVGSLGNGLYWVSFFPKDITGCAYVASVGSIDDGIAPELYATVEQRTGQPSDLRLRAFDDTGGLTPPGSGNGFHVAVFCP